MFGKMQLGAGNRLSVPTVRMMLLPKWASKVEKMGKNRQLGVVEKLRKSDVKLKKMGLKLRKCGGKFEKKMVGKLRKSGGKIEKKWDKTRAGNSRLSPLCG